MSVAYVVVIVVFWFFGFFIETKQKKEMYHFASIFMMKHLRRNSNWVGCATKNCDFGWIWSQNDNSETKRLQCKACGQTQNVKKGMQCVDDEIQELFKCGILRKCPKCEWATKNVKGTSNIIHCGRCSVHWNWLTRQMIDNYKDKRVMSIM